MAVAGLGRERRLGRHGGDGLRRRRGGRGPAAHGAGRGRDADALQSVLRGRRQHRELLRRARPAAGLGRGAAERRHGVRARRAPPRAPLARRADHRHHRPQARLRRRRHEGVGGGDAAPGDRQDAAAGGDRRRIHRPAALPRPWRRGVRRRGRGRAAPSGRAAALVPVGDRRPGAGGERARRLHRGPVLGRDRLSGRPRPRRGRRPRLGRSEPTAGRRPRRRRSSRPWRASDGARIPPRTEGGLPRRLGDFATLADALDYAAERRDGAELLQRQGRALGRPALSRLARRRAVAGPSLAARGPCPRRPGGDRRRNPSRRGRRVLRLPVRRPDPGAAAAPARLRGQGRLCGAHPPPCRGGAGFRAVRATAAGGLAVALRPRRRTQGVRHRGGAAAGSAGCRGTAARALAAGGRRLPAILLGQHALSHRRRGAAAGADEQCRRDRAARAAGAPGRPRGVLAAALPRHGPGRLPARAARRADLGGPAALAGFRAAAAPLAAVAVGEPRHALLQSELRLRALRPPRTRRRRRRRGRSTCPRGAWPASAAT